MAISAVWWLRQAICSANLRTDHIAVHFFAVIVNVLKLFVTPFISLVLWYLHFYECIATVWQGGSEDLIMSVILTWLCNSCNSFDLGKLQLQSSQVVDDSRCSQTMQLTLYTSPTGDLVVPTCKWFLSTGLEPFWQDAILTTSDSNGFQ